MSFSRSLALSFAQKHTILLVRLLALLALARLLTPSDFGVFAAANALIAMVQIVAEFGTQQVIIKEYTASFSTWRAAMGLSFGVSVGLGAALLVTTIALPTVLMADQLRTAVQALILILLLAPPIAVGTAILQREMRFGELYWIGVTGAIVSACLSIVLAWRGNGFMSLVWAGIVENALAAAFLVARGGWVLPSFNGWRALFRFGWVWVATDGLRQAADATVRLVIGGAFGYAALGLLSRADAVINLFDRMVIESASPVLLPLITERLRQGDEIASIYAAKIIYLSAVAWPFFAFVAGFSEALVHVLLGPQWIDAVPLVRILCIGGLFLPFSGLVLPFLVSLDMTRRYLPFQFSIQAVKALAVLAASFISLELACAAITAEAALTGALAHSLIGTELGLRWKVLAKPLGGSAVAALLALSAATAVAAVNGPGGHWLVLAAGGSAASVSWLLALLASRHPVGVKLAGAYRRSRARFFTDKPSRW